MTATRGPSLSQLPIQLTLKDAAGAAITNGSVAVVISDVSADAKSSPGTVLLTSTAMPQAGTTGVYAYTAAANLYQPGTVVKHVVTGKDSGGNTVVTLAAFWQDSGA